jgi:hypothetical protein
MSNVDRVDLLRLRLKSAMALRAAAVIMLMQTNAHNALAQDIMIVGDLRQIATNTLIGTKSLRDVLASPHAYGLGMIAGLDGELLVQGSSAKLGRYRNGTYEIAAPTSELIAFGVFAIVPEWRATVIPAGVTTFKQLEALIAAEVMSRFPNRTSPTPFRLRGTAQSLKWFVVGGMGDLQPTPRESFVKRLTRGTLQNAPISAFGFYTSGPRGITTNPASSIHAHFETTAGAPFVGHIDDEIIFAPGAELLLPEK